MTPNRVATSRTPRAPRHHLEGPLSSSSRPPRPGQRRRFRPRCVDLRFDPPARWKMLYNSRSDAPSSIDGASSKSCASPELRNSLYARLHEPNVGLDVDLGEPWEQIGEGREAPVVTQISVFRGSVVFRTNDSLDGIVRWRRDDPNDEPEPPSITDISPPPSTTCRISRPNWTASLLTKIDLTQQRAGGLALRGDRRRFERCASRTMFSSSRDCCRRVLSRAIY